MKVSLLTLLEEKSIKGVKEWKNKYLCDCGNITYTEGWRVRSGHTTSCGCHRRKVMLNSITKHGLIKENKRLYGVWLGIKRRCYNKNEMYYCYYGGRGIIMCNDWKNNFQKFHEWSIKNGYAKGLTIDRVDGNKNYEPSNCRWITQSVNSRNTRKNLGDSLALKIRGLMDKGMSVREVCKKYNIAKSTAKKIKYRMSYGNI